MLCINASSVSFSSRLLLSTLWQYNPRCRAFLCGVVWIVYDISGSGQNNGPVFKGSDFQEDRLPLEILIFGENWDPAPKRKWQKKKSENLNLRGEIGLKCGILTYNCCSTSINILEVRRLLEKTLRGEQQQNSRYEVVTVASTKLTVLQNVTQYSLVHIYNSEEMHGRKNRPKLISIERFENLVFTLFTTSLTLNNSGNAYVEQHYCRSFVFVPEENSWILSRKLL